MGFYTNYWAVKKKINQLFSQAIERIATAPDAVTDPAGNGVASLKFSVLTDVLSAQVSGLCARYVSKITPHKYFAPERQRTLGT